VRLLLDEKQAHSMPASGRGSNRRVGVLRSAAFL
jgi:hypothetical protein